MKFVLCFASRASDSENTMIDVEDLVALLAFAERMAKEHNGADLIISHDPPTIEVHDGYVE